MKWQISIVLGGNEFRFHPPLVIPKSRGDDPLSPSRVVNRGNPLLKILMLLKNIFELLVIRQSSIDHAYQFIAAGIDRVGVVFKRGKVLGSETHHWRKFDSFLRESLPKEPNFRPNKGRLLGHNSASQCLKKLLHRRNLRCLLIALRAHVVINPNQINVGKTRPNKVIRGLGGRRTFLCAYFGTKERKRIKP